MATLTPSIRVNPVHAPRLTLRAHLLRAVQTLELWYDRAEQRRALRELPDHVLHDMALSQADIEAEASKPFWKP
jgi:uncharacterized protein YjiS (DUF1127 family)